MWNAISIVAGTALVLFTVREMFHDLFHPSVGGAVSDWVATALFGILRRWPRWLALAGPLSVVVVIFVWAFLFAGGFALIYFGMPPAMYDLQPSAQSPSHSFWTAFYFSLESMTTLGLGDIKPLTVWLTVIFSLETLFGLALMTASVTWILLIYPALSRTRHLATTATILAESEDRTGIDIFAGDSETALGQLLSGLIRLRVDHIHFPVIYYFRADNEAACMARAVGYIEKMARRAAEPERTEKIRLLATALSIALDRYAEVLRDQMGYAKDSDRVIVFKAYAEEHRRGLAAVG